MEGIVVWIVVGFIGGLIASLVLRRGVSYVDATLVGIVGAAIIQWFVALLGAGFAIGFNLPSLVAAFVGALIIFALVNLAHQTYPLRS